MKKGKKNQESKKVSQGKLVINSITDLLKIPIQKIHNSKIENFSGIYFDKIYEEAIISESKSKDIKSTNSNKIQIHNKIPKQNGKDSISPKLDLMNKNEPLKAENYIIDSKNLFNYYEDDDEDEIPRNKHRIEYKNIKNNPKELYPKDDDTQDNDIEPAKNDTHTKYTKPNPQDIILKRKNSQIPVNKIIFSVNYNSVFGEEVAILGSLSKLGLWELSGALPLKWNEGNIWTGEINIEDEDYQNFEFKFIVVEKGKIKRWEGGENNVIIFDELINNIISNKIGRYNKYKYEYDKNESTLSIKCQWH